MGDPVPIALGRGARKSKFGLEGIGGHVNAYVEDHGDGSKTGFTSYAINGSELYATLSGGGAIRSMLDLGGLFLVVSGQRLFEVRPGGAATDVGGIPSDGFVTMARNQATPTDVAIVCDGAWYLYASGAVAEGTDPALPPPVCVIAKDGYFIFLIADGRWFIVGPNTTTIDGLLFASAESQPDSNVMGAVRGPDVLLFGERSTEFFQNTGAADFPFTRSHVLNVGCWAAGSVQNIVARVGDRLVDTVAWAATDNQGEFAGLYILDGLTPLKISTAEMDDAIASEPMRASIRSESWTERSINGKTHTFYNISGSSFSYTFDFSTGEPHRRRSAGLDRWRMQNTVLFQGSRIWGDYNENKLYVSRPDLMTEAGASIVYEITTPTVSLGPHRFRVNAIWLDALTGVGTASVTDADANPVMMVDYSRDGGVSFGAMRSVSMGAGGQRHTRIKERTFGRFDHNGVAFRFRCSAAVRKGIQNLHIDADKLGA